MRSLKCWGHTCFQLIKDDVSILFNPFLTSNPNFSDDIKNIKTNYIFISHGDYDYLGDTIAIAKQSNATIVSTSEITNYCAEQGCKVHGMNLGGKHNFDFGYVRVTLAFHGSGIPGGHACGFVVNFYGVNVYFAGDTALFGDMALIGRLERIDYALLPIGDNYTMGPADAVEAVGMLRPRYVVPMHYNTWPSIAQDPSQFRDAVQERFRIAVHIIAPGETILLSHK